MRSQLPLAALALTVAACGFAPAVTSDGNTDVIPDAGTCNGASAMCLGDVLRVCESGSGSSTDTTCNWGCSLAPMPRCLQVVPSGGGVTPDQVAGTGLGAPPLIGVLIVNGSTGEIGTMALPGSIRAAGTGVKNGIDYSVNTGVAIFRFASLQISGTLALAGTNAIAFVADGTVTIDNEIDARGSCALINAGPGGLAGGAAKTTAAGSGGGTGGGTDNNIGGAGGGHGGTGGVGGSSTGHPAGGNPFGDAMISVLVGGGGGGGGGGDPNAGRVGGGGGGAFQIVSNASITLHPNAGINAGGCGGKSGNNNQAASGGGAGGAILLEAPQVVVQGYVTVNGGGGAGGDAGGDGSAGQPTRTAAMGGLPANNGTGGGPGAAASHLDGFNGIDAAGSKHSGGGGGAVGRIRINTRTGTVVLGANVVLSPALDDSPTTTTAGIAAIK